MTHLYVAMNILLHGVTARMRRNERGQGTLEYVGMVAVAAVIVLAMLGVAKDFDFAGIITGAIKRVKDAVTGG